MDFQSKSGLLLSIAYLPPISYLKSIVNSKTVTIEQYENYSKHSYRNRCRIYAANGILDLSVPVILATRKKVLIKDVKIDYSISWQKQHIKSIESAYRTSPFFDYLFDDFLPFYNNNYPFLLDFNLKLLDVIFDILQLNNKIDLSVDYEHNLSDKLDLRNSFSPKMVNSTTENLKPYPQVFDAKFGFIPDLSCIDLIFNLGTQAYSYLIDRY